MPSLTKLQRWCASLDLRMAEKAVLNWIAMHCDSEGKCSKISRAYIAQGVSLTEPCVSRKLRDLQDLGLLSVERTRGFGKGQLNVYQILMPGLMDTPEIEVEHETEVTEDYLPEVTVTDVTESHLKELRKGVIITQTPPPTPPPGEPMDFFGTEPEPDQPKPDPDPDAEPPFTHERAFELFWELYPRGHWKQSKAKCKEIHKRNIRSWAQSDALLDRLEEDMASAQWTTPKRDTGKPCIPHATTWLNRKRHLDDPGDQSEGASGEPMDGQKYIAMIYGIEYTPEMQEIDRQAREGAVR